MSKFLDDTKKILDFFDNKELQEIFTNNYIHRDKIREIVTKLKIAEMRLSGEGAKIDDELRKRRLNFKKKEGEDLSMVYWYFEKLKEELKL
jgi:hypothetical protein